MSADLHARARRGMRLLLGRQLLLQLLTFGAGVVLARVLEPAHLGLYAITSFLVSTFALVGDFGLAPSFIQRKAELTEHDLRVGFTLQLLAATVIVLTLFAAAPWLASLYPGAPRETPWLVRALDLNLFLTSWRAMSALQLERQLRYERLVWVEVIETLSYQGTAVGMALAGAGAWSFVAGTLVSGVLGAGLLYRIAPWRMRLALDLRTVREILRFGIPFQLAVLADQAGGWATPILVARMAGPQAVGLVTWGLGNGRRPLILVANVMRVAFPHFARIQDDPREVERLVVRYLTGLLIPTGLWFAAMLVAGAALVRWVYTDKWLPAVPTLVVCSAGLSADVMAWVGGAALMGVGKAGRATRRVLLRTLLTLALCVPLVHRFGLVGVASAGAIAGCLVMPWIFNDLSPGAARRVLGALVWLMAPLVVGIAAGEAINRAVLSQPFHGLVALGATSGAYLAAAALAAPPWLRRAITARLPRILRHANSADNARLWEHWGDRELCRAPAPRLAGTGAYDGHRDERAGP